MNKLCFFLLLGLMNIKVLAQIGTGQWRLHVPNKKCIDVVATDQSVFAAFENGLLEYDFNASETSLWTDVNSLSDISLTCLTYDEINNAIFVGYSNGNIDKIKNNQVYNIPAIRLAEIQGNKRINRIVPFGDFIYFATGFSIVKIDPIKNEVKETFYPINDGSPIVDVAFKGDSIYAMTPTRIFRANLNNFALGDPSQWVLETRIPILSVDAYTDLEILDDRIYYLKKDPAYGLDTVFQVGSSGNSIVSDPNFSNEINSMDNENGKLILNMDGAINTLNVDNSVSFSISSYTLQSWIAPLNSFRRNNITWMADKTLGLIRFNNEYSMIPITFDGPPKNEFYAMDWQKGKLAVAGGGLSSIANTFSGSGIYTFEDESWSLYDRDNMTLWNNKPIWDFLSVSIDPRNPDKMAVGSYSEIPVSILENGTQVTDTFTPNNSTLNFTQAGSEWSLVSSLQYDEDGNLWVLNGFSDTPLNVYSKDGVWYAIDCGTAAKNKFTKKIVIDYNGNKWFSIEGVGVFGYNENETIADPSDDNLVLLNSGPLSGELPSNSVNAIAVDFDNEIWIGTDNGFAVLYNSSSAFDALPGDYNADRIKVQFEGNVEYVLGNTNVTDIEVDGANRKWFGTANSGIILLSADGLDVIEQHTTENSPLISNNIIDLKLDQNTGELFIITDKGLVSYRTDATYQDASYSNVSVFPNPVRPEFQGPITIQGIRYDSDVKITDVAGNLVYKTVSNGGTATWNGKTLDGEDVTTGVYLIWTAPVEGDGRFVGKVLVVRD
jgi:hypothetical protein